jgi:hypothetical protein
MPRRTFLIVDAAGSRLGILKALREQWSPGEQLSVRGRTSQVARVVELEQPDSSGAAAMLIVTNPPAATG